MIRLIASLGNPGIEYHNTKHNIGWDVLEYLSFAGDLRWTDKYKGLYANYEGFEEKLHLIKPMTFMNLSGESIRPLSQFFKIPPEEILVIHDELDLPFGSIAFKNGGGLAGHNGLKSIAAQLGTQNFKRLRLGIGRPDRGSVSSWVLSGYPPQQKMLIDDYLQGAAKAIEVCLKQGFEKAASQYSKKKIVTSE